MTDAPDRTPEQIIYDAARTLFALARALPAEAALVNAMGTILEQRGASYWASSFRAIRQARLERGA